MLEDTLYLMATAFCKDVELMGEGAFNKRYEQWKRSNLFTLASETMPEQVDKDRVLDDLRKLHSEYIEDLSQET